MTKKSQDDTISILAYNYSREEPNAPQFYYTRDNSKELQEIGEPEEIRITVEDVRPGSKFIMETLDKNHGFAINAWKEMGQPEPPTREQTAELKKIALATKKEYLYADDKGRLMLHLKIDPWSIVSIREER